MLSIVLLGAVLLFCLMIIPVGLPGTWLMLLAAFLYGPVAGVPRIGTITLVVLACLALVAELIEFRASLSYTGRYGGSKRAGWGAIAGGLMGALIGLPVPVVGSILGAFAGAFAGALVGELSTGAGGDAASKAAFGAVVGRAVATAVKCAVGVVMAVWILGAARS
jgi:uncharacterized protein YqgC (DUF456 family)